MNLSQARSQVAAVWGVLDPQIGLREVGQGLPGGLLVRGGVDGFESGGDLLAVPVGHEPHRSTDQVDHAGLDRCLGPGRLDRLGQARQPVTAHDQHVAHASVGQLGAHKPPFKEAPSSAWTQILKPRA